MLDELLGRAALKDRIEELEAERDDLEDQLEAESERRADAVTDKQRAQRRVNELEDRVEELEDRVERAERETGDHSFRREATLRDARRTEVLDRLESVVTGPEGAFSAYVPEGTDLAPAVRAAFGDRARLVGRAAPCLAFTDDAGLVGACLSVPDPPDAFDRWADGFRVEREWFEPRGEYALALVRSNLFALGEYRGGERVAYHGFDSELKSQHSKGGFSQARFERLRDEQIESHLERCRTAIEERSVDRLYVVGEGELVGSFDEVARRTATVDASGDPEAALADAHRSFWSVRLRTL